MVLSFTNWLVLRMD